VGHFNVMFHESHIPRYITELYIDYKGPWIWSTVDLGNAYNRVHGNVLGILEMLKEKWDS